MADLNKEEMQLKIADLERQFELLKSENKSEKKQIVERIENIEKKVF